ncbi:MAG: glycosyltransferase [Lachnospiraceae bacterium]|nr:glycosyltransferase [Lachnospiraceae bacterium]
MWIIAINDGSSDNTSEVVNGLLDKYEKLRFIDLKENNGKANALYLGLIASKGEILMGVDSDAYIMPDALNYIVPHFTNPYNGERVGAVTGNPRVDSHNNCLGFFAYICHILGLWNSCSEKWMVSSGIYNI